MSFVLREDSFEEQENYFYKAFNVHAEFQTFNNKTIYTSRVNIIDWILI